MSARNEKAASGCTPKAAHEKPSNAPVSMNERNPRGKSNAACRPVAAGDNLVRTLAEDLAAVFGREAPEVSLTALGHAIILEGQRRGARP